MTSLAPATRSVLGAGKELEFFRTAAEDKTAFYSEDEDKPNCLFTGANYNTRAQRQASPLERVEHRTVPDTASARTSVGVFIVPTLDCLLAPAEEFVSGDNYPPRRYPLVTVAGSDGEAAAVLLRPPLQQLPDQRPQLHSPPARRGPLGRPRSPTASSPVATTTPEPFAMH
ncbi:hypothetical protein HU200_028242 [Digitaria exilis]|uniref:Uncharacterized protein n=1 Tax=Digitaria exilis TaxID=1010633 RepID=A0A835EVW3_9POAL|nr:hypothetical protein HU200_028242 [Digitaria exilis]